MRRTDRSKIRLASLFSVAVLVVGTTGARADFAFGGPTNLGPIVNGPSDDGSPSISADGVELFLDSTRPGGSGDRDLWVAVRATTEDDWGLPVNLGSAINSPTSDVQPNTSADGLSLFFASDRPGGQGGLDLWITTRVTKDDTWAKPVNLGEIVNSTNNEWSPSITADGLSLFFCSGRSGGLGRWDTWMTTRASVSDPWGEPVNLGSPVNSPTGEFYVGTSANGLSLFLSEYDAPFRAGGFGGGDIWLTRRANKSDPWGRPVNLGPTVNTGAWDVSADISADGSTLYFCSDRAGGSGALDLYQVAIVPVVDFNGDEIVDFKDLVILIENWGQNEPSVDIGPTPWGDGKVDEKDLQVLMRYWQQEVLPVSLIAYWKLDEAEGVMAADRVGENDGTLHGGPLWQPAGGKTGGALLLDGVDDYVSTTLVLDPAAGPFSVFAWVKGGAPGQVILSQKSGTNWLMAGASDGGLSSELKSSGRAGKALKSTVSITDSAWHRVGFVWDGSNRILYVDDMEVVRDTQTALVGTYTGLHIGAGSALAPSSCWKGLIDDVRIYDRVVIP
jgi:hypothetical protein